MSDQLQCKVLIFATCPIQKNIYLTIKNPHYPDCSLNIEKIDFKWKKDLEELIYLHIDEFQIQKKEEFKISLEKMFENLKLTTPLVKITINSILVSETDFVDNNHIDTLDEYFYILGFIFGQPIIPIIRVIIPKNKDKRVSIEKIAPLQIHPKVYADRWQGLDFEKHFTENFASVLFASRKFKQIGMAIYFYLNALLMTQLNFRIIEYHICWEILESVKGDPKISTSEKNFLIKFNETHREEFGKYKQMRRKLVHPPWQLTKDVKIKDKKIAIEWPQDVNKFRTLIENLIIDFSKIVYTNNEGMLNFKKNDGEIQ